MSATTEDPQTWVYPAPGSASPPVAATSNFGPLYLGDSLVLEWTPATHPDVYQTCISKFGDLTSIYISKGASTPLSYKISEAPNTVNSSDRIFCHVAFLGTQLGNSVTWELINKIAEKPVTYSRAGAGPASSSASGALSSSTGSASSQTQSLSTSTSIAQSPSQSQPPSGAASPTGSTASASSGLSTGAKVGIGVAVPLGVLVIAGLVFLCLCRRRKQRGQQEMREGDPYIHEKAAPGNTRYELDHNNVRHELPAS